MKIVFIILSLLISLSLFILFNNLSGVPFTHWQIPEDVMKASFVISLACSVTFVVLLVTTPQGDRK